MITSIYMKPILGWKIWYSDKTFDSTQGSWADAPVDDAQVIMVYFDEYDPHGRPTRLVMKGCDYYGFDGKEFTSDFDDKKKVKGEIKNGWYTDWDKLMALEKESFDDYGMGWLVFPPPIGDIKG